MVPQTLSTRVGQDFEVEVHILKMKFDKDLCLNLQYDFGKMNSTLGSVVPLAMFILLFWQHFCSIFKDPIVMPFKVFILFITWFAGARYTT